MSFINDFLSLIYPRYCEACTNHLFKHELYLCNYCKLNLPQSNYHRQFESELSKLFIGRVPLQHACSFYLYEKGGKIQNLLHAIKYQDQPKLAEYLGEEYGKQLQKDSFFTNIDCVIPIPLHANKLKARGYNQSECFAKGLSEALNKEMKTELLYRVIDTKTQTKKSKYQRWENVDGIFKINDSDSLTNKHVLIVDDVVTTGATIEAAWLALKSIDGIRISVASIAFAPRI